MITYIIRRLLLMIPTLFGITVMVFLIARLAPGKPGQLAGEGGSMSAEQAKALAEWYEKRYGLNLPLHQQYLRWLRSMFIRDVLADAWYRSDDGSLLPVHTIRRAPAEYYARLDDGSWWQVDRLFFADATLSSDDPAFTSAVRTTDLELQPPNREGYDPPVHVFARGVWRPIESLDDVASDLLKRATELRPVSTPVSTWFSRANEGAPLFQHPSDPDRFVFQVDSDWYVLTPDSPPARWSVLGVNDPKLHTLLGSSVYELPPVVDDYVIPRHAVATGSVEKLPDDFTFTPAARFTFPAPATAPAGIWVDPTQSDAELASPKAVMLYQQKEPHPILLVRAGESWKRLIGRTRVEVPESKLLAPDEPGFDTPPDSTTTGTDALRRQVVLEGKLEAFDIAGLDPNRDLRPYQQPREVLDITLGESSQSKLTILQEMRNRLPITLLINVFAFPIIYAIAIPMGMLMAVRRGKPFDTGANFLLLALWSIPSVLAGTLLIGYTARGGSGVEWFPNNGLTTIGSDTWRFVGGWTTDAAGNSLWEPGYLMDLAWHLVLPIICIIYAQLAYLSKQMRASMLDNLSMDYVRTARAKGVAHKDIIFRHAFANGLLPLITIVATLLPAMIAGSVIIERIFGIEGMGLLFLRGVQNRDYDVVQAVTLISGILNLTGLLLADICYALADPRITFK